MIVPSEGALFTWIWAWELFHNWNILSKYSHFTLLW